MSQRDERVTELKTIASWLQNAQLAVAFTGAGISTESGIPDFRSPGGVWSTSQPVYFDEFLRSAEARQAYWQQKVTTHEEFIRAVPNRGHVVLAKWEGAGYLRGVITQNIDGLHQLAGSQQVLELHGTARVVACLECEARFDAGEMVQRFVAQGYPPECPACGGLLKHATVSFGQQLPTDVLEKAVEWSAQADLFLAMGSSLVVRPAASLPELAQQRGARLVIINREPTPLDHLADLVIRGSIGETLSLIDDVIEGRVALE